MINNKEMLDCIFIGPYPYPHEITKIKDCGVSVILNVAGSTQDKTKGIDYFSIPIEDLSPIPIDKFKKCYTIIKNTIKDKKKIYVHCSAGQNRSPTIVWLFMIAHGIDQNKAKEMIEDKYIDAIPGHPLMIDEKLVKYALSLKNKN